MTTMSDIEKVIRPTVLAKPLVTDKRVPDRANLLDERVFHIRREWFDQEYRWHECGDCNRIATEVALSHGCLNSTESVVADWYGHKNLTDLLS